MKKIIFTILVLGLVSCAEKNLSKKSETAPQASSPPVLFPRPTGPVTLVEDKLPPGGIVRLFIDKKLEASRSGTFGPGGLRTLGKDFRKKRNLFYIVDLRQESHGLINDAPYTWQSEKEWATAGLTHDEAIHRERRLLWDLHIGDMIGAVKISSFETEESLVRSSGFNYQRLTFLKHVRPEDSEVERFHSFVSSLPEGAWLHFHDRDGGDRSTAAMIMYDCYKNSAKEDFASIVLRQKKLAQREDSFDEERGESWEAPYKKEYMSFLKSYCEYTATPQEGRVPWTVWERR